MTRKERVIQMMLAVAPTFVEQGLALQKRLIDAGHDPSTCLANGKDIPHDYADYARQWAEAFVDEMENIEA